MLRKVPVKYSRHEKNRAKDFIHKLTTHSIRTFKGYVHGFENIDKKGMFTSSNSIIEILERAVGKL